MKRSSKFFIACGVSITIGIILAVTGAGMIPGIVLIVGGAFSSIAGLGQVQEETKVKRGQKQQINTSIEKITTPPPKFKLELKKPSNAASSNKLKPDFVKGNQNGSYHRFPYQTIRANQVIYHHQPGNWCRRGRGI